jgi:hypothetical protein
VHYRPLSRVANGRAGGYFHDGVSQLHKNLFLRVPQLAQPGFSHCCRLWSVKNAYETHQKKVDTVAFIFVKFTFVPSVKADRFNFKAVGYIYGSFPQSF